MGPNIAIIAEYSNGKVNPATYELMALAEKIQGRKKGEICFITIGEDAEKAAGIISAATGCLVHAITVSGLLKYNGAVYKKALSALFAKKPFDYICAPHSTAGMDYAPALAVALGASCITGVQEVATKDGTPCFLRSMFGGKLVATIVPHSFPLVLTLQPGSLQAGFPNKKNCVRVEKTMYTCDEDKMVFTGTKSSPSEGSDLDKADVIVSGGRGIKEAHNYKYIEMLAGLFPRSATGASRPICDYKWINYGKQVGITGTTVSPRLYIACGISGTSQHVEAIRGAGFIIAINTDPDAPVFQVADVCIVEDLMEFIPLFIETFKKKRRHQNERNHLGNPFLA